MVPPWRRAAEKFEKLVLSDAIFKGKSSVQCCGRAQVRTRAIHSVFDAVPRLERLRNWFRFRRARSWATRSWGKWVCQKQGRGAVAAADRRAAARREMRSGCPYACCPLLGPRRMFLKICFKISHASQERKKMRNMPCLGRDPLFLLWLLWSPQLSIWFSLLGACYSAA